MRLVAAYFLFKDMVYERKSRNECDEIFHNKNTISTNNQFTNDNQSFSLLTSKETAPGLQPDIVQPLFPCSPECLARRIERDIHHGPYDLVGHHYLNNIITTNSYIIKEASPIEYAQTHTTTTTKEKKSPKSVKAIGHKRISDPMVCSGDEKNTHISSLRATQSAKLSPKPSFDKDAYDFLSNSASEANKYITSLENAVNVMSETILSAFKTTVSSQSNAIQT